MPREVRIALLLLGIAMVVALIHFVIYAPQGNLAESGPYSRAGVAWSIGSTIFLIVLIAKRRNWARIVFTILSVLFAIVLLPAYLRGVRFDIDGILGVIEISLQLVAPVLLFLPRANHWFRHTAEKHT